MIQFNLGIPISIHPFFWLFSALIGWMMSGNLIGALIWMGIIFFSVLIHEFGHALTATLFKQKARIQFIAMGGVTMFEGPKLKFWQQFLITFNGPLFGFLLFLGASALLTLQWSPTVMIILKYTQVANLFWTIVNLLPVLPLDGGQLLRIVLEAAFGVKGFKASLLIGAILAALLSFYFFMLQAFLLGAFFFLFAFQSFESWRQSRFATVADRDEGTKELMVKAEALLQEGKELEAKQLLEQVRVKAPDSMFGITAIQYLAFIAIKEGKRHAAYELLLPIKKHLGEESLCLLHELSFEAKNYALVCELSAGAYQVAPSQKSALNNARSFAHRHQAKLAGGWLQTAWQYGALDLQKVLQEKEFQAIVNDPEFKEFVDKIQ